jgi:hypothetical protein
MCIKQIEDDAKLEAEGFEQLPGIKDSERRSRFLNCGRRWTIAIAYACQAKLSPDVSSARIWQEAATTNMEAASNDTKILLKDHPNAEISAKLNALRDDLTLRQTIFNKLNALQSATERNTRLEVSFSPRPHGLSQTLARALCYKVKRLCGGNDGLDIILEYSSAAPDTPSAAA